MFATKYKNRIFLIISIVILILSAILTVFPYRIPLRRLVDSCKDFGRSVAYLFVFLFEGHFKAAGKEVPQIWASVAEMPDTQSYIDYIGIDINSILQTVTDYFGRVFDVFNFLDYNSFLLSLIVVFLLYGVVLIPCVYVSLNSIYNCYLEFKEDSLGKKSKFYNAFIFLSKNVKRFFRIVLDYISYAVGCKWFMIILVIIWLVNFGVLCFIPDFLAFYLYFLPSLDVGSFVCMLLRFLLNALIILKAVPLWLIFVTVAVIYHRHHKNIALDVLRHNEAKNCGLIKELELVILIIGETGKGKTTLLTDIILSLVNIYKTDSLKILYKIEMYFPAFDFSSFRAALIPKIANRDIFCIPDIDDVVNAMFEEYESASDGSFLYGYETELFGDSVNLGNRRLCLRDALIIYGRAFLIYQNNNPTVANYSIRFDGEFDDSPFLKLWDGDFFKSEAESYYSHILDSDIERFGKKVDPNGKFNGSFGYGIWVRTEAAKSYGNHISNSGYKMDSDEANPLNDRVEYSAKMGRHTNSMVDNVSFFRKLMDEQRASDLTVKIRELCSIISIEGDSELKLAITGYGWLFALRDKCKSFENVFLKYYNARADFTLAFMLIKFFVSFVNLCCVRLENVYGYKEKTLIIEGGTAYSDNGVQKEPKRVTWYQSNMKVYGERFASDCYASFFTELQKKCGYGIMDYPTYDSLRPTMEQYESQKDFFLMKMMEIVYGTGDSNSQNNSTADEFANLIFSE